MNLLPKDRNLSHSIIGSDFYKGKLAVLHSDRLGVHFRINGVGLNNEIFPRWQANGEFAIFIAGGFRGQMPIGGAHHFQWTFRASLPVDLYSIEADRWGGSDRGVQFVLPCR